MKHYRSSMGLSLTAPGRTMVEMKRLRQKADRCDHKSKFPEDSNLNRCIEEFEMSVRSYNFLRNANIKTIGDLVQRSEQEMLRIRNFGRKSLNEIKEILSSMGLSLADPSDPG